MLATIPFFETFPIVIIKDVIEIHVFVVLATWLAQKRATEKELSPVIVGDLGLWLVITGFIMAHQVSLFAYYPDRVFGPNGSWLEVFKISSGISSFGGFLGAAMGMIWFFNVERIVLIPKMLEFRGGKGRPVLKYLDVMAYGFTVGWFFGRMGCFSAHDHVGLASTSALAVNFPDGWRDSVPAIAGYGAPRCSTSFSGSGPTGRRGSGRVGMPPSSSSSTHRSASTSTPSARPTLTAQTSGTLRSSCRRVSRPVSLVRWRCSSSDW